MINRINQMQDQNHLDDFRIGQIYLVYLADYNCFWPAKIIEVNLSRQKSQSQKNIKAQFYNLGDTLNRPKRQMIDLKKIKSGDIVSFEGVFLKQNFGSKVLLNDREDRGISQKLKIAMDKAKSDFQQTLKSSKSYLKLRKIANESKNKLNKKTELSPFSSSVSSRSQRYNNRDKSRTQSLKQKETPIIKGSSQYHNVIKQNQGQTQRINNKNSIVKSEVDSRQKSLDEKYNRANYSKSKAFDNKKGKNISDKKAQIVESKRWRGKIRNDEANCPISSSIENIQVPKKKRKGSQTTINVQVQKQNDKFLIGTKLNRSNKKSKIMEQKLQESKVCYPQSVSVKNQPKTQIDDLKQQKVKNLYLGATHATNSKNSKDLLKTQIIMNQSTSISSLNMSLRKNKNKSTNIFQKTNLVEDLKGDAEFYSVLSSRHDNKDKDLTNYQFRKPKVSIKKKQSSTILNKNVKQKGRKKNQEQNKIDEEINLQTNAKPKELCKRNHNKTNLHFQSQLQKDRNPSVSKNCSDRCPVKKNLNQKLIADQSSIHASQFQIIGNDLVKLESNNANAENEILDKKIFQEQRKNLRLVLQQKLFFESYFKNVDLCSDSSQKYLIYAQLIGDKEKRQIQTLCSRKVFSLARILDKICQNSQVKEFIFKNNSKTSIGNKSKCTNQIIAQNDESNNLRSIFNQTKEQSQEKTKRTSQDGMKTIEKLKQIKKISGLMDIFKMITAQELKIGNFGNDTKKKSKYVILFILNNHEPIKKEEKKQQQIQVENQSYEHPIRKGEKNFQNGEDFLIWRVDDFIVHSFYSLLTSLNLLLSIKTEQNTSVRSNIASKKENIYVSNRLNKGKGKRKRIDSKNKSKAQESISLNNLTNYRTECSQTVLALLFEHLSIVSQLYVNLLCQKAKLNLNPKGIISNPSEKDNLINFRKECNIKFPFYDFLVSKELKKLSNYGIEWILGGLSEKERNNICSLQKGNDAEGQFKKMKQNMQYLIEIYNKSQFNASGQNTKVSYNSFKKDKTQGRLQQIKEDEKNQKTNDQFESLKQIIKRNYCLERAGQLRKTQFKQSLKIPQILKAYIKQEFQSLSTNSEYASLSSKKININTNMKASSNQNLKEMKEKQSDSRIKMEENNKVREPRSFTYSNKDPRLKMKRSVNYSQPMNSESNADGRPIINGPSTNSSSIYSNQQVVKLQTKIPYTWINGSRASFTQFEYFRSVQSHENEEESAILSSLSQTLTTVYENEASTDGLGKKPIRQNQSSQEMHQIRNLQNEIINELKEFFISDQIELQV